MVAEAQLNLTEIIVLRTGYYWLNYKNYYSKDWALSTTTTTKNHSSNYCSKDWTLLTNYKIYCSKDWTLKISSTLLNWFANYLIQIYCVYWIFVFRKMTTQKIVLKIIKQPHQYLKRVCHINHGKTKLICGN